MVANALETLDRALRIKPDSALAYCLSGAAHARVDSFESAESDFKRALELDEQLAAARLMLANLYMHHGDWKLAAENLNKYLDDFPYSPDWLVVRKMLDSATAKESARPSRQ
jgi:tetratricopeptide (TPR) repeat protein